MTIFKDNKCKVFHMNEMLSVEIITINCAVTRYTTTYLLSREIIIGKIQTTSVTITSFHNNECSIETFRLKYLERLPVNYQNSLYKSSTNLILIDIINIIFTTYITITHCSHNICAEPLFLALISIMITKIRKIITEYTTIYLLIAIESGNQTNNIKINIIII